MGGGGGGAGDGATGAAAAAAASAAAAGASEAGAGSLGRPSLSVNDGWMILVGFNHPLHPSSFPSPSTEFRCGEQQLRLCGSAGPWATLSFIR